MAATVPLPLPLPPAFVGTALPAAPPVAATAADLGGLCEAVHTARAVRRCLGLFTDWLMSLVYHYSHTHGRYPCGPVALKVNGTPAGSAGFSLMRVSALARPTAAQIRAKFRETFSATPYAAAHIEGLVRKHLQDTCDDILRSGVAPPGAWAKVNRRSPATPRARRASGASGRPALPDPDSDRDTDGDEETDAERPRGARPTTDPLAPGAVHSRSAVGRFWLERLRALKASLAIPAAAPARRRLLEPYADAIDGCIKAARVVIAHDLLQVGTRLTTEAWARDVFPDVAAWKAARTPRYWKSAAGRSAHTLLPDELLWALLLAFDGKRVAERRYEEDHGALAAHLAGRFRVAARTTTHASGAGHVVSLCCPLPVSQYQLELLRTHAPPAHALLRASARPPDAANRPYLAFASD